MQMIFFALHRRLFSCNFMLHLEYSLKARESHDLMGIYSFLLHVQEISQLPFLCAKREYAQNYRILAMVQLRIFKEL